ncbi:MAG: hypothetical protein CMQ40_09540 [Gammaproteobacteria bacterium]|nr:hypothetical protein [Gammaproteobacteria bacterium]|tara:strand:- start:1050 stop:1379 length:330 start_codon:yes stop_codon:yes gene_type:complete
MKKLFQKLLMMGPLRNLLHATALLLSFMMPVSILQIESETLALIFLGALPASAPIIVIIIGLDIMMTSIWKTEAASKDESRYKEIIRAHIFFGGVLLFSWLAAFLPRMI